MLSMHVPGSCRLTGSLCRCVIGCLEVDAVSSAEALRFKTGVGTNSVTFACPTNTFRNKATTLRVCRNISELDEARFSGSVSRDHSIEGVAAGRLHISMHDIGALSSLAISARLHIATRSKNRFSYRLAAYGDLSEV